jgi:preprotein translocase subunit SecA
MTAAGATLRAAHPQAEPLRRQPWPGLPVAGRRTHEAWQAWDRSREAAARLSRAALQHGAWALRGRLRVAQLGGVPGASALGFVAGAAQTVLGLRPHDEQGYAAWLMLQGHLAEMATGEGKTLATGLAAATAGLAGLTVHVMTANDYLVARDRERLEPLFTLLGLRSAAIVTATPRLQRADAYRHDIVYVTARELVFDHLKDHLARQAERDPRILRARAMGGAVPGAQPVVPRFQQAFVDEADSILLDEASIPFILSTPGAPVAAGPLAEARALALRLPLGLMRLQPRQRQARLTAAGLQWLRGQLAPDSPLWPLRRAQEWVRAALVAEHLLQRDRDYAVRDGAVALIDEITGRIAEGRQWNHPLQALVEAKEGLPPSTPMVTAARVTYQRLFPRYERLGGMSGTLSEARGELHALYRCRTRAVPRVRPSQRAWLGRRLFADAASRDAACIARIEVLRLAGRPVLVGTESVEASRRLSQQLAHRGIEHAVLHATQDADEARLVARAGEPGRVTVTTNMAGRGTDIVLDPAARAAGGLHVVLALCNRSRRIDRQLAGRAGRQGDPGSAEALLSLDDQAMRLWVPAALRAAAARCAGAGGELPSGWASVLAAWVQRRCEWRDRLHRRDLGLLDEHLGEQLAFSGRGE